MNCREYENLITEYLENTAPHSLRVQMESHLSECEKCRIQTEQEKAVIKQFDGFHIEPCPDEIINHVLESISGQDISLKERIRSRIRSWFKPGHPMRYGVASLAGSAFIVLIALFIHITGQQRQSMKVVKYSPEEVKQATIEARLAFAYFAVYSRKTEAALQKIDLVEPVIKPIEGELKKVLDKIPCI